MSIYDEMVELISAGKSVVTATLFNVSGSVPRGAGARMIIREDGTISGTIGGGKLEAEAMKMAPEVYNTKTSTIFPFNLSGSDAGNMGMICGGSGEFLVDYIDAGDPVNIEIYRAVSEAEKKREKGWLVTAIYTSGDRKGAKQQCFIRPDQTITGRFEADSAFLAKLIYGPARINIHSEVVEGLKILVEPVRCSSKVYLFGAGHVSQKVAPVAESVGFSTIVIDDRAEFANSGRFPNSEVVLLDSFDNPFPDLQFDDTSYLVIVTRGHAYDMIVLGRVMRAPVAYIGMIGSRGKRAGVYKSLADEFGYTDEDFARVHSPIGLSIGAESPEEIAVSIVAELIQVRAGREGCSAVKK